MVANILPAAPPPPHASGGDKIHVFQIMVMWNIKLKGFVNATTWYQLFYPRVGSKGQSSTFQNMAMLHNK